MEKFENPITVSALAERIGCPRHRIYSLINNGTLKPQTVGGVYVFFPAYATLIMDAVIYFHFKKRTVIRFNFI